MVDESEDEECTHEEYYLGCCIGCGDPIEYDDDYIAYMSEREYQRPLPTGCMNRGWYHDGSEEQEAYEQKRPVRPCPHGIGAH